MRPAPVETLRALGGATHEVVSGVALVRTGDGAEPPLTATVRTEVTFRELERALMDWYVATGEWRGRSGGYAIQGAGAVLVRAWRGRTRTSSACRWRRCSTSTPSCWGDDDRACGARRRA